MYPIHQSTELDLQILLIRCILSPASDPYAVVSFCNGTQQTEKQMKTLCPTWDQTLIFDDVPLSGHVDDAVSQAPKVVVEVFDWDARVSRHACLRKRLQTACS